MALDKFLSALWDDITGKDANGRNAEEKKQYSQTIIVLSSALAIAASVMAFPVGLFVWVLPAYKFWLHKTNTF